MKIALIGNQNSGKTTLFNALTGLNQKVGNWPGVTVEKKEGVIRGTTHTLVDLPGIYSLSPYTAEENIACDYLLRKSGSDHQHHRRRHRTVPLPYPQLLELDIPVLVALNMADILIKRADGSIRKTGDASGSGSSHDLRPQTRRCSGIDR